MAGEFDWTACCAGDRRRLSLRARSPLARCRQRAHLHQLVQDEDVHYHRCHPRESYIEDMSDSQMSFAICLQVPNHLHFKKYLNIYAEFIPQILFMWSIFGYLLVCIIYKWSVDWSQSTTAPPGLLNMLIYMFLSPGTVDASSQLYAGQGFVQTLLLLIALVCVPWMLCLKPYMLYREHQRVIGQGYRGLTGQENGNGRPSTSEELEDDEEGAGQAVAEGGEEHHVGLKRLASIKLIHCRDSRWEMSSYTRSSTPSNSVWAVFQIRVPLCPRSAHPADGGYSASYLRLWALSLAHAQLSEVLYTMTIENAFLYEGNGVVATIFLVVMFAMWFSLTLAILCVMEGLSAFLHALRLHWYVNNIYASQAS